MLRIMILAVFVLLCLAPQGPAQEDIDTRIAQTRNDLEQALNVWTKQSIMGARAGFERLLDRDGRDWLVRYYIALADYRLAIWHIAMNDRKAIRPYLDEGEEILKESIDANPAFGEAHALLGATL